ncbi:MAG: hypothetical protein ACTHX2_01695 [Microbacterium sp.]
MSTPTSADDRRGKPGRRRRGDRASRTIRYPTDWQDHLERRARIVGIDVGSYLTLAIAEHEKLPVPEYILDEIEDTKRKRAARAAEELDLPQTA